MATTHSPAPPVQEASRTPRTPWLTLLFCVTSFIGAALLFMVQPIVAKAVLPSYGGSASVWSTSSLFFQVLLLIGYVYAHVSTRRWGARWQPRLHIAVLFLPLLVLPLALPDDLAPGEHSPVLWLLRGLTIMVALPFLVVSATGPLMQRWYTWAGGARAEDPYFIFAASNLGSFVGLLAYPFAIEPLLTLAQQRHLWSMGFLVFAGCMVVCAIAVRSPRTSPASSDSEPSRSRPIWRLVTTWIFLAFVPSSLMLAATAHISTDVAPIPLLWVLALGAYLLSFVAAFARTSRTLPTTVIALCVVFTVAVGLVSSAGLTLPIVPVVIAEIAAVGLTGYAAHVRLAVLRPDPEHLTGYYLVISVGGALGGLLNGVVAPLLFNGVWEYLLTVALVPLLALGLCPADWRPSRRVAMGFGGTAVAVLMLTAIFRLLGGIPLDLALLTVVLSPVVLAVGWLTMRAPKHLSAALLITTVLVPVAQEHGALHTDRSFYGSYRVTATDDEHKLAHGTTIHGSQFIEPDLRGEPTTYYARSGPLGDIMDVASHQHTAVVGLGAGAITAYGGPGDALTYFEIDAGVVEIARNPDYFTYLRDTDADVRIEVGDGRLLLAKAPEEAFDLVVLDAFSSDAIPVHLLTQEAFGTYLSRMERTGVLAVHISNRVFDLEPVLAATAREHSLHAVIGDGGDDVAGGTRSRWVALTRDESAAAALTSRSEWRPVEASRTEVWTDDYSSILSVLK